MLRNLFPINRVTVSTFKYRGATVTIQADKATITRDEYREYLDGVNDCRQVSVIYAKHKLGTGATICGTINSVRYRLKRNSYQLNVSLGGKTEYSNIGNEYRNIASLCDSINTLRQELMYRLRRHKTRYEQNTAKFYNPTSLFNSNISYRGECAYFGSRNKGWVRATSGQILAMQRSRITTRLFDSVKPRTAERHVGIEIECGIRISKEDLAVKLMPFAGYVMVKGDGSVNVPDRQSVELNICAPVSSYKSILQGVTSVLNSEEVGAKVNKTCGLHVHLDVRNQAYSVTEEMYSKLVSVQPILYSMQPKSRQDNTYCKRTKTRYISRGSSRYQGINAQSIWKYNTIEVRLHAGTTDFRKIANWVDLLCGVTYGESVTPKRSLSSVRSFFRTFHSVPTTLMEYVVERARRFSDGTTEESEVAEAI